MVEYTDVINTDVAWLPQIPAHWQLQKIDALFTERKTKVSDKDYAPLSVTKKGILPQLEHAAKSNDSDNRKLVKAGDFVINSRSDRKGSCGVSKLDGSVSLINLVLTPRSKLNNDYVHYLLRNYRFSEEYYRNGRGIVADLWTTRYSEMRTILLPVPPRAEQDQIVRFLDWKVSEINKLIVIRRKEIQEFNQLKNTVITKTVTTGLKREELCGTDNSYYRMIPKGWRLTKTLRVLSQPLTDGPHTTPQLYEEGIPFVSAEAVSCGNGKIDFNHIRGFISQDFYEECCKKYVPKIDDIYMIKSGATTGRVSIVDTDRIFTIWSPLAVFRCNQEVMLPRFLFYAMQALPYQQQVQDGWSYGTQQNIGMRVLEQLKLAYPDVTEQEKIACYLDDKCDMLDKAIQLAESKIKALQELKSTIISDVVTGKIDVRNVTVPEYEHVDDFVDDDCENHEETDEIEIDGEEA